MGMSKWIYPAGTLFHFGEKRSYHYLYDDYIRNKIIAAYLYGGKDWVTLFSQNCKGRPTTLASMRDEIIRKCSDQRLKIKENQKMTIQEWSAKWTTS